ncbi:MAG: hypothetical protein IJ153_11505, partial [Clostridia bacterium]|nr:hypothetical protein [Clostridia bacterium]
MSWEYEALFNRQETAMMEQLNIWSAQPTAVKVGTMGYRTRTTWAGERLEAEVYPIYGREQRAEARARKANISSEAQKRLNDKRAEHHLILMIETNFTREDLHLLLTYETEPTEKRAMKDLQNFFSRVRRARKAANLPPLKYVYAMGGGEEENEKRIHFHLVVNGGIERDHLERIWRATPGAGRADSDRLQPDERGLEAITKYIFKQHKDRAIDPGAKIIRRWNGSRNLKKPKSSASDSRCSNARVRRIAHDMMNEAKREMEKVYPGYRFVDCTVYYSDVIDGVYIRCLMRKKRGRDATVIDFDAIMAKDKEVKRKTEALQMIRAKATDISPKITGMPSGGGDGKRMERDVVGIVDAEESCNQSKRELEAMRKELAVY